jgi:hypothetical protein
MQIIKIFIIFKKNAITAMSSMVNTALLAIGSADCCVTIYELGTQVFLNLILTTFKKMLQLNLKIKILKIY